MVSGLRTAKLTLLIMVMLLAGCKMSGERLVEDLSRRLGKMQGYYAELDAVVYSPEGEQPYRVRQWVHLPEKWRVEVSFEKQKQIFLCDGEQIWVYEEGFAEYFRFPADNAGEMPPPFLLWNIMEKMTTALPGIEFHGEVTEGSERFYSVSYRDDAYGETVRLLLDKKTLFPVKADTFHTDGALLSSMRCTALELNPSFEEWLFQYTPDAEDEVALKCMVMPMTIEDAKNSWPLPLYVPSYLPEDTRLFSITHSAENGSEQLLMVFVGSYPFTFVQRDGREAQVSKTTGMEEVMINDDRGLYQRNVQDGLQTLWWSNRGGDFILTGSLPKTELLKIARSLREE